MVIFGATGDLMLSKLLPSLFKLYQDKKLGEKFYIIGFARREFSDKDFREFLKNNLNTNNPDYNNFLEHFYYQQGFFGKPEGYYNLINKLQEFDQKNGACITRIFYLATPPLNYLEIIENLHKSKLSEGCGHESSKLTKIVIEKPFGKDLETAKEIDKKLSTLFLEEQIFRVDHYLAKETVQNLLAFRFANGMFEPIWNKNYLDHVQITWAEKKGIEERGDFFDGVGLLRDVMQNHLMQLITAVTMRAPSSFSKEGVRDARAEAIKALRCVEPSEDLEKGKVVRGQYENYKNEKGISKDSNTETFVAMKLFVDIDRFLNVPFYVRAGKNMPQNIVEISLVFIQTCHLLFKEYGCPEIGNVLTIRIQPDEGIRIRIIAKKPAAKLMLKTVDLKFSYKEEFGEAVSDAYEKLLLDIFNGDQMLFNRSDELSSSWGFITDILEKWSKEESENFEIPIYKPNTWGPKEAEELIEEDGRRWIK